MKMEKKTCWIYNVLDIEEIVFKESISTTINDRISFGAWWILIEVSSWLLLLPIEEDANKLLGFL